VEIGNLVVPSRSFVASGINALLDTPLINRALKVVPFHFLVSDVIQ